jgi:anti-sigma B factor antagonist
MEAGDLATQVDPLSHQVDLTVTVRQAGTQTVMQLAGELDLATAAILREALLLLDLDGGINLVIDLRNLSFLGSTGISVLVVACKRVRAAGGTFSVWCDHDWVRRTLEIIGLVDFFELQDGEGPHPNHQAAHSFNE